MAWLGLGTKTKKKKIVVWVKTNTYLRIGTFHHHGYKNKHAVKDV